MKRLKTPVMANVNLGDNEIYDVEILDYDRDRYYTIRLPDGQILDVKYWALYNFPSDFNKYKLPYDYEYGISNKDIAEDLRKHKRYNYKFLNSSRVELTINFMIDGVSVRKVGTRKQLLGYVHHYHNQGKLNDFYFGISFYKKGIVSFGNIITYEDGAITAITKDFRNKKENKYIKQLIRSMFCIN